MSLLLGLVVSLSPPGQPRPIMTADGVLLTWPRSPDAEVYEVFIKDTAGSWKFLGKVSPPSNRFVDMDAEVGGTYTYRVDAVRNDQRASSPEITLVYRPGWYDPSRTNILVFLLLYAAVFFAFLVWSRQGKALTIRKIAGLEELDNAVGRSTEMGKPILFVHGLGWIGDLPTIAALTILKHIARKAAEYETPLLVPNNDPMVMAASKEVIKEACLELGRPDLYNEDHVFFVSQQQFAFAAAVDGIALRERPGAIFLLGYFYAESLMFAEVGQSVGAIQVSGTTATDQLPFFVAACDYTLIGEELYAASAYLSRDAVQIATLKAEDIFKLALSALVILGSVAEGLGLKLLFDLLAT